MSMVQGWKGGELQGLAHLSYFVHLMGNRASSLFKHGAPPCCYSHVLESRDALDARLLKHMKWDWTPLVALELPGDDDQGLAEALRICIDALKDHAAIL